MEIKKCKNKSFRFAPCFAVEVISGLKIKREKIIISCKQIKKYINVSPILSSIHSHLLIAHIIFTYAILERIIKKEKIIR